MGMMKQQLETLAARVNSGDISITDELMTAVANHNIRQDSDACWWWTNEHGTSTCGGVGVLAEFIKNGCRTWYIPTRG